MEAPYGKAGGRAGAKPLMAKIYRRPGLCYNYILISFRPVRVGRTKALLRGAAPLEQYRRMTAGGKIPFDPSIVNI